MAFFVRLGIYSIKHNIKSKLLNLLEQKIRDISNGITSLTESRVGYEKQCRR